MQPATAASSEPTWLQYALDHFARLRSKAAHTQAQLQCMPVIIAASTRASACSLKNTASRKSQIKDLQLWQVTEEDSTRIIQDLLQRMGRGSRPSAGLPANVLVLLRLLGGSPRLLADALVALSGQGELSDEEYIAGTCQALSPPLQQCGIIRLVRARSLTGAKLFLRCLRGFP